MPKKPRNSLLAALFFVALYLLSFAARFVSGRVIAGGDTLLSHSLWYTVLYSLKEFGELPYWEPSINGGFPFFFNFLMGETNILAPHTAIFLVVFRLFSWLFPIDTWISLYIFVYCPLLNATLIALCARCVTSHRVSALYCFVTYLFSYYSLLNVHDYSAVAVLPPALFVVYSTLRYAKQPTPSSAAGLILSISIFIAGFCANTLFSAGFWVPLWLISTVVFFPPLVKRFFSHIQKLFSQRRMLSASLAGALLFSVAAQVIQYRASEGVVRNRGGAFEYAEKNIWSSHDLRIKSAPLWSALLNWVPFKDYARENGDLWEHGHQNYYIGLASAVFLIAGLFVSNSRWILVFLSVFLVCNLFLIKSVCNLAYEELLSRVDVLRVLHHMATLFPRGGPSLFLILGAGIGLDSLLFRKGRAGTAALRVFAKSLPVLGGIFLMAAIFTIFSSEKTNPKESYFGIGLLLLVYGAVFIKWARGRVTHGTLTFFFVLLTVDLLLSQASYFFENIQYDGKGMRVAAVHWMSISHHPDLRPDRTRRFGVKASGDPSFFPETMPSHYHNAVMPFCAMKEWLVAETHPALHPLLVGWEDRIRRMKTYPNLALYEGKGHYVPKSNLSDIAQMEKTVREHPEALYLHDPRDSAQRAWQVPVQRSVKVTQFSYNHLTVEVKTEAPGFLVDIDNFHPYWRATVNGKPTVVRQANFVGKAVEVPSGSSVVEFRFEPRPLQATYLVFYLFLGLALIILYLGPWPRGIGASGT